MKLEHLDYLLTVADCGSIHEASRKLLLKQQYVSNVIKSLEEHFDTKIFERTSKGVVPTENGRYLIEKARIICDTYADMNASYLYPDNQKRIAETDRITLYLPAYLDSEYLVAVVDEFNEYFPNVDVTITSQLLREDYATVLADTSEHALLLYPCELDTETFTDRLDAVLSYEDLESTPLMLFAATTNPEAQKRSVISIKEALSLNLAILAPISLDASPIYKILRKYGEPTLTYIVDNPMMLFRLMQKRNCYTIAKHNILDNNPAILGIPFQESISLHLYLVYHPDVLESYAVRSLIQLIKKAAEPDQLNTHKKRLKAQPSVRLPP